MKKKCLIFLEFESELSIVDTISLNENEELVVLTTSPNCFVALQKKGIQAIDPLRHFPISSHEKTSKWSTQHLDTLKETFGPEIVKEMGHESYLNYFLFYSQFYINYLLYHIELYLNLFEMEKIEKVFIAKGRTHCSKQVMIKNTEFPLDIILEKVADFLSLEKTFVETNEVQDLPIEAPFYIKPLLSIEAYLQAVNLKKTIEEKVIITSSSYYSFDRALALMKEETGRKIVYLHSGDNNARDGYSGVVLRCLKTIAFQLASLFKLKNIVGYKDFDYVFSLENQIYRTSPKHISIGSKELWDFIKGLRFREISFGDLVYKKLGDSMELGFKNLKTLEEEVNSKILNIKDSIFVAPHSTGTSSLLAEMFDKKGRDSLLMAHGTMPPPGEPKFERELFYISLVQLNSVSKRVLIQSKLELQHLEHYNSDKSTYIHGPLVWGRTNAKNTFKRDRWGIDGEKNKVFLHASSQKSRFSQRLLSYETPFEYVENIRLILKSVEKIPSAILVVKFRPTSTLSLETLRFFLGNSDRLVIDVETPFVEVLAVSDVLISYSSTTIEEAIFNRVPVVIFGGDNRGKFFPVREGGDSGVFYAKDPDGLEITLVKSLDSKITKEDESFYLLEDVSKLSFKQIENKIVKERDYGTV